MKERVARLVEIAEKHELLPAEGFAIYFYKESNYLSGLFKSKDNIVVQVEECLGGHNVIKLSDKHSQSLGRVSRIKKD